MISKETIARIFDAIDIEDVIGDFVTLKRKGANLWACCPFHNEDTPSFSVSPSKGIYKCFGCGKSGNALNFVMEHEKLSYPEALRYLAKKYNIPVEEEQITPEEAEAEAFRETYYNINSFALRFFNDALWNSEEGKAIGLTYFEERGFKKTTIEKFQLGFSPNNRFALCDAAKNAGHNLEHFAKLGLLKKDNTHYYDTYRGRVIFPIHSLSGKIIGFGGRILVKSDKSPKYINSPESEIYDKSKSLYGIYFARKSISQNDCCYLVEGYTDVISLHQAGIENVVASSGTSLTIEQIRLIKRFTKNITILYDGDPAGIKAALRGINLVLEEGMNVKVLLFPDGEDPDSFARKHLHSEVIDFIKNNAVDFIDFKTRLLLEDVKGDPLKKAALTKEISETIALIPDKLTREAYAKKCSETLETNERYIIEFINKAHLKRLQDKAKKETQEAEQPTLEDFLETTAEAQIDIDPDSTEYQERYIIRLLLLFGNNTLTFVDPHNHRETIQITTFDYIYQNLTLDNITFENPVYQKIFNLMFEGSQSGAFPDINFFTQHEDKDVFETVIEILAQEIQLSKNWQEKFGIEIIPDNDKLVFEKIVRRAILRLKLKHIYRFIRELKRKISAAATEEEADEIMKDYLAYKQLARQMEKELGRVIVS